MKRKPITIKNIILGVIALILFSCTDVNLTNISNEVKIQESLVIPVGEGTISISDLLAKMNLQNQISLDADTINFVTELNKEYVFNDINLLKNITAKNISFPIPAASVAPNTAIPLVGGNDFSIDLALDPNSTTSRFDSVKIATTSFAITLSVADIKVLSNNSPILPSDLKLTLVFPKMHYYNSTAPITKDVTFNQFGQSSPVVISDFILKSGGLTGVPFQVQFKTGNRDLIVGSSAKIDLNLNISQLNYTVAYGKFQPNTSVATNLKIPLDMLSLLPVGLRFANPKASINLQSNIGSYLRFNILSVKAFSKDGLNTKQALFNGSPTATEVIDMKPTPGLFISKNLRTLDNVYGTTDQLFDTSVKLDTLEYKFSLQTDDALNNGSPSPEFIIPGMKMKANVKIKIPFYLKSGSNISLNDTVRNLSATLKNIENATLVLKITNGLPVKVTYSMQFLDAAKKVISSTINNGSYVINSGTVDSKGIVTAATETTLNIDLTTEQMAQIQNANSMVYTLKVAGQDATSAIQFTKTNFFKLKLGVFAKTSINTTLSTSK